MNDQNERHYTDIIRDEAEKCGALCLRMSDTGMKKRNGLNFDNLLWFPHYGCRCAFIEMKIKDKPLTDGEKSFAKVHGNSFIVRVYFDKFVISQILVEKEVNPVPKNNLREVIEHIRLIIC